MYYASGNYEAFARPKKPVGVDQKSAYIIGSGLGALAAACFLVRDGQMKGSHVHILEKDPIQAVHVMVISTAILAMLCVADVRWITILSVCGICSVRFRPSRQRVSVY